MDINFEFATRDDCLDRMVPSDLRQVVAERDQLKAQVERLEKERDQFRLQRDVLALNRDSKDTQVMVVMDGKDVAGVVWPKYQTASLPFVNLPNYLKEQAK